jgi:hypothetical protein
MKPGFRDCIWAPFASGFGIRALFFALDAPQGAPRQEPQCAAAESRLRNPPKANRGIRVKRIKFATRQNCREIVAHGFQF